MLRLDSPITGKLACIIGALGLGAVGTAAAQTTGYDAYASGYVSEPQDSSSSQSLFSPVPVKSAKWIAIISANGSYYPTFRGADKYVFTPYPTLSIRRGGEARRPEIPGDGFDIDLLNNDYVSFGPVARYQPGRYFADDRKLFGLRKLPWTVEGGAFVELWPSHNFRVRAEARHGVRDENGWVASFAADVVQPIGPVLFTIGPRATWMSNRTAHNTYGVTWSEAQLNNLVFPQHALYAYKPTSGVESAGAATSLGYKFDDSWSATATASYNRLVGDAGKSPLVRRLGERNQFAVGLKASYTIGVY